MANKWAILRAFLTTKNFTEHKQLQRFQQKKLQHILKNHHTQFYPHSEHLADYPVIDKKIFMAHFAHINRAGIDEQTALQVALQAENSRDFSPTLNTKVGKLTVGLSSGTSGSRGIFLVSASEAAQWAGYILKRLLPKPWLRQHRIAFFLRANSNLYETVSSRLIDFAFYDLLTPLTQHIAQLNQQQPSVLIAPAQVLVQLAQNPHVAITPEKIISVAEVLDSSDKAIIAKRFEQTIHQVYQCTEGFLAHTCEHGQLHLNEDIVYIEKDWLDKKSGRFMPIITDFNRRTQPMIRYRLDDILVADTSQAPCPCGSVFTQLSAIEGRCDDSLQVLDIHGKPYVLYPDFVRRAIISTAEKITEYRVTQHGSQLHIELAPLSAQYAVAAAMQQLFHTHGVLPLHIHFAQYTPSAAHEKRRRVSCKMGVSCSY